MDGLLLVEGLGDDADVGDAGLLDGVHHGGEGAEGDLLVGADVDDACFALVGGGAEERGQIVDVDRLVLRGRRSGPCRW